LSDTREADDPGGELPEAARMALQSGNKIEAIKALREAGGISLKDAKDTVERYLAADPVLQRQIASSQSEQLRRLLFGLAVLAAAAAAGYFFLHGA
jgi:ribosomal protein L7/L12